MFVESLDEYLRQSRPERSAGFVRLRGFGGVWEECLCWFQMCVFLQTLVISPDAHLRRRPITTSPRVFLGL